MPDERIRASQPLIVVLENDDLTGEGLGLLLRDADYRAVIFKSFYDARQAVAVAATAVSAIISDFDLDLDLNGVEAAQALRADRTPQPPVLIVTGSRQRRMVTVARKAGFEVAAKPASPAFIRRWLARNTAGHPRSPLL
jgi:DNA-binding response OmpR family regulator